MIITPLSEALGAEVRGIDLRRFGDDDLKEIKAAFSKFQMLCFRDQELSPKEQLEFSAGFGEIESRPDRHFTFPGIREVSILSNRVHKGQPVGVISAGDFWHSDLSFGVKPCRANFLYALEVAKDGGDTEWSNMYAALDRLPLSLRSRIEGLHGIHVFDRRRNPRAEVDRQFKKNAENVYGVSIADAVHPIVRTHPETGRKALYISPRFVVGIEGLPDDEGQKLLDELFEFQIKPEFRYRHKWRAGDLVMWDNPCLIHIGRGKIKSPGIRHMHRTMVLGEKPY